MDQGDKNTQQNDVVIMNEITQLVYTVGRLESIVHETNNSVASLAESVKVLNENAASNDFCAFCVFNIFCKRNKRAKEI